MNINTWEEFFQQEFKQPYAQTLLAKIEARDAVTEVYPPKALRMQAFTLCPLDQVKVVMIGQDPYHQPGQANGLAFSVNPGVPLPPSLRNIYKEIKTDCLVQMNDQSGDLTYLAQQGVLLLNASLTVERDRPLAHQDYGYHQLLEAVLKLLNEAAQPLVFMLWGAQAKRYRQWLTNPRHLVLTAHHPSPLSANRGGWFGCQHFSKTNAWLVGHHMSPIQWSNILPTDLVY
jgi:uracil-DNA glycosylase